MPKSHPKERNAVHVDLILTSTVYSMFDSTVDSNGNSNVDSYVDSNVVSTVGSDVVSIADSECSFKQLDPNVDSNVFSFRI